MWRRNIDEDIRKLEREALNDPVSAEKLYAYWIRTGNLPALPGRIAIPWNYRNRAYEIVLFDSENIDASASAGAAAVNTKYMPAWIVYLAEELSMWFYLVDGVLESHTVLDDKKRVVPRRWARLSERDQQLFSALRRWSQQHQEEIKRAQQAWRIYRFLLYHNKYQRELALVEETRQRLAVHVVKILREED